MGGGGPGNGELSVMVVTINGSIIILNCSRCMHFFNVACKDRNFYLNNVIRIL